MTYHFIGELYNLAAWTGQEDESQGLTTGCILPIGHSVAYIYLEFKLRCLNLKLFSIRVKGLFEFKKNNNNSNNVKLGREICI